MPNFPAPQASTVFTIAGAAYAQAHAWHEVTRQRILTYHIESFGRAVVVWRNHKPGPREIKTLPVPAEALPYPTPPMGGDWNYTFRVWPEAGGCQFTILHTQSGKTTYFPDVLTFTAFSPALPETRPATLPLTGPECGECDWPAQQRHEFWVLPECWKMFTAWEYGNQPLAAYEFSFVLLTVATEIYVTHLPTGKAVRLTQAPHWQEQRCWTE